MILLVFLLMLLVLLVLLVYILCIYSEGAGLFIYKLRRWGNRRNRRNGATNRLGTIPHSVDFSA